MSKMSNILKKSNTNKVLFGVCGGLSEYFGIDATVVRILFILGSIFSGSILFWIYLLLVLIMPNKE